MDTLAAETGFIRDNLEKVLRLCEVLHYINDNPFLSEHLVLKGGTAINLTVFHLPRLSVDIDLDFNKQCTREEMLAIRERLNQDLTNYMFRGGYSLSPNTKNPHSLDSWVFYYQNSVGNKDNIKVEINYSMRHHILPVVARRITVPFAGHDFDIRVLAPAELFGSKIKALLERAAARDLYDIHNMINHHIIVDKEQELLRKIVLFYFIVGGNGNLSTLSKFEHIRRLNFPKIRSSLLPVLRRSDRFDLEAAKVGVISYFNKLLIYTDKEYSFAENFYQGSYCPELLFDDAAIAARIQDHPMAVWKMKRNNE
ncbi:MAG: nucleotidyl transferase AbiEii/AbiGii toxin family protein [Prevotellaceae bacterium]|nr:nucleotidyl transferase AbiEii/AbiGii toxin family protein [Prevotellaceae bacterium]